MSTCIHMCYHLNTDKKVTHAFKICCIKDKKRHDAHKHTRKLTHKMYIHTQTVRADVHQHSDSNSLIYKITTCYHWITTMVL